MTQAWLFTSESVAAGHPDKLCDAISDAILDACLALDPKAKVAVETLVKGREDRSHIVLAGEVKLAAGIDAPDYVAIARTTAAAIGYTSHGIGMDATSEERCEVTELITSQSAHINRGVVQSVDEQGAGDQGLMFGYACNETEAFPEHQGRWMPMAIALSQALTRRVSKLGLDGTLPWARPDAKSQVTLMHGDDGQPLYADNVVIAVQHKDMIDEHGSEEAEQAYVREQVIEHVIRPVVPASLLLDDKTTIHVNSTGRFADPGGPYADAGLTGRKIIVDTYGGMGRHGGGAFSGKDPSKVDRSAAYMARYVAKNVVAAGLADRCELQLAYAIGYPDPVSVHVDTFGTNQVDEAKIVSGVQEVFSFKPADFISQLNLLRPIYRKTTNYGHFGREDDLNALTWEKTDKVDDLKSACS